MSKYLTAEQILSADDFRYAEVDVPEWGGTVRVRTMSAKQRDALNRMFKDRGEVESTEFMLLMCVVDENGNRVLKREHLDMLKEKSVAPINRIVKAISDLMGTSSDAVESAEKNYAATMTEDLPID
jgi:hypothetical protein